MTYDEAKKLKKGDKILCVEGDLPSLLTGNVYEFSCGCADFIYLKIKGTDSGGYYLRRFEIIKPKMSYAKWDSIYCSKGKK
jgi:hypothetical protein